jgi:hypothetical protein
MSEVILIANKRVKKKLVLVEEKKKSDRERGDEID